MNSTIQFAATSSGGSSGTPVRVVFPLIVPDRTAFRVRWVDFWISGLQAGDMNSFAAVSKLSVDRAKISLAAYLASTDFIARDSYFSELTTTGEAATKTARRVELWDADYRFVLRPVLHVVSVVNTFATWNVQIAGELVGASEGDRNAIIAFQGGAKD